MTSTLSNKAPGKDALAFKGKAFETLLSSKMTKMSTEERSDGLHDVHGVAGLQEETSEMIGRNMEAMNQALHKKCMKLRSMDTEAFRKAVAASREYVESIKILFLRCENYDGQEAADGILRFFERKLQLFDEGLLTKDIQLKDLDAESVDVLRKGVWNLSDQRDRAGRVILFMDGSLNNDSFATKSVMRALYYLTMSALRDVEIQKKGMVVIVYANDQKQFVPGRSIECMTSWRALPMNVRAFHYCLDSKEVNLAIYAFCRLMENGKICRFKVHRGTHMENIYKLMTFGVPKDAIPVDYDGNVDPTSHNAMLKVIDSKEQGKGDDIDPATTSSPLSIVLVPGPFDILLGRGRHPHCTLGGLRMRNLLEANKEVYDNSKKREKTQIAEEIVKRLKDSGCRFRKPVPGGYAECDDSVAREKISHGFRNLRLKDNPTNESEECRKRECEPNYR